MGTLAFIMFVALALLNTSRGKEAETREPAPVETTKSEVIIDKQHDNVPNVVTKAAGQTMPPPLTLSQFMGRIINAFKGAFNDPSLIEYANQQGIGIADSPTHPVSHSLPRSRHQVNRTDPRQTTSITSQLYEITTLLVFFENRRLDCSISLVLWRFKRRERR